MKRAPAESSELRAAFQSVKAQASELTTNYFAGIEQERKWALAGALSQLRTPRCLLLFRRDRHFEHLYHVCNRTGGTGRGSAALVDPIPGLPIVTDLLGRPEDVAPIAEIYRQNGI